MNGNPFYVSPLGGLNVGQSLQNMGNQWRQNEIDEQARQAQEAQQQKRARLQDLGAKAMSGDLQASQQLWVESPEYAAQIDKGLGIQNEQQAQNGRVSKSVFLWICRALRRQCTGTRDLKTHKKQQR